jgi:hypothetical protein
LSKEYNKVAGEAGSGRLRTGASLWFAGVHFVPGGLFLGGFFFGDGALEIGAFGDLGAEVGGPVFIGLLLHLLVLGVFRGAGGDESGDVGLVGRRFDAFGQSGGGAGGILGFVAADGVSEGVFGDRPGAVEGVTLAGSGEQSSGAGDSG